MRIQRRSFTFIAAIIVTCLLAIVSNGAASQQDQRAKAAKLLRDGNYKDSYDIYSKLVIEPKNDQVGGDLWQALTCLQSLNRLDEVDSLIEKCVKIHESNWRLLSAAAQMYSNTQHYGYIVAGEFSRGYHRGGGRYVSAFQRDRIRSLQLMTLAMDKIKGKTNSADAASFFLSFADLLRRSEYGGDWRLQELSDPSTLPDYDEYYYHYGDRRSAPVDPDGNPVYFYTPKSYEEAKSDGERMRWMYMQAVERNPELLNNVRMQWATFLSQQFGTETLAYDHDFGRLNEAAVDSGKTSVYALHTLGEDETIARLANGIKRFKLPDEFNFIKVYQSIADDPKTGHGEQSLNALAAIFTNRRQYPKAVDYWKRSIKEYGDGNHYKQETIGQIVGNWGRFTPHVIQPAGKGADVGFRFRNGKRVQFEAYEILVEKLLKDLKAHIKSDPRQLEWSKVNIENMGYRLVNEGESQYISKKSASWELDLEPLPNHFDKEISVATPLQKAGAYLLKAIMADGNTSYVIVWLTDTVIVKKPLDGQCYLFLADASTGKPIPRANVEFFGYRQTYDNKGNRPHITTANFAEKSDNNGQVFVAPSLMTTDHSWLITATDGNGRFAFLGFTGVWYGNRYDQEYNQTRVIAITDRPVYRPKQKVNFKAWIRYAKYDLREDGSDFANQQFSVVVHNPKGEEIHRQSVMSDAYGGVAGELELPVDATLGVYGINVNGMGGGSFRVEEYKKPEFEVTVEAPTDPVMLGEKITATIKAKYYFGAPVTTAKVKYKVLRTGETLSWYPICIWDWLYNPGYWWYCYDYDWYPGWHLWGCRRPIPWWWGGRYQPPEVVAQSEVEIGSDGTLKVEIDTALAKEIHGDTDHRYEIIAEVVDESRRTIVGTGNVIVARAPFKVYTWVDRGHYKTGDTIRAWFSAQKPDNKPVKGKGVLNLMRISYDDKMKPAESSIQKWDLDTNLEGRAEIQIKASEAGQYRLSYTLTDSAGHAIEGGYIFVVAGEGFDGSKFRFNDLELVQDKQEYAPGDKVKLMVNTNRTESTVLLFLRPTNGTYLPPKVLSLKGKSVTEEIEVIKKDMPNFFVEALTVSGGKVHVQSKEIVVPPEKRVLNVEVLPSAREYKPGEKASVKIKLTDVLGNPFIGAAVVSVYDKAVEYISGGSNVPEIKAFFWSWRRHHSEQTESNVNRWFDNLTEQNKPSMTNLGVFGHIVGQLGAADDARKRDGDSLNAPISAKAETGAAGEAFKDVEKKGADGARGDKPGASPQSPGQSVAPSVRTNFADTALWVGSLETDKDGTAEVSLSMPENLTTWKIKTWAMGHGTKVGEGSAEVVTTKKLILRLQAPRFFVEKDEAVLSANIHNYLKNNKDVRAVLELDGACLTPIDGAERKVTIAPNGEARVDWRVAVVKEGTAIVRMKALTDEESDAMEMRFPVYVHGMDKMVAASGLIRPDKESAEFVIDVPKDRRVNESRLEVRFSPSLAAAMVDALPYMTDYPYGCTEQTLNRFLPAVVTQKVLLNMGLDLKSIRDKRNNLNAQELGDPKARAAQWQRYPRNPVFDNDEVSLMVKDGVKRLTEMQCSDGGWGWFSGWGEHSWSHTTATVVHGLQTAMANDVAIVPGVLEAGIAWLTRYQNEQVRMIKNAPSKTYPWKESADNLDAMVFMVLVDANVKNGEMMEFLYRDRNNLAVYSKALLGLALHKLGEEKLLAMILQNIEQFLVRDDENQTCYLNLGNGGYWWYWYGSENEAHAYYLKLLAKTDPKGWKAPYLVKYLLNNRKHATYWASTRDTALCIEAMADYIRASGEDKPDMTIEVLVDGKKMKEVAVNASTLFTFDNTFVLFGDAVETGKHTVTLRKKGRGPLYFNGYLSYFSLEDFITKAGLEVKVERKYYKLVPVDKSVGVSGTRGEVVRQKVEKYKREAIENLAQLKSGDLVEIELEIESKNDYEYLIFEDMKPAGFEAVDLRSGYTANDMGAYMEFRDNRVCMFVRALARGKHSLSYRMRAEIPGKYSALPARAAAMYAPELRGNSDEIKLFVKD